MLARLIAKRLLAAALSLAGPCVLFPVLAQVKDANSLNSRPVLHESRNWELRGIVRTRDRQHLAAVGTVTKERGTTDGFFMLLDATTGDIVGEPKFFGGSHDDALNGVAETGDNTFCLVGRTTLGPGEQSRAWVIYLGADLRPISEWKDPDVCFPRVQSLERIAWPEGSHFGIVQAPLGDDGNAWLGRVGRLAKSCAGDTARKMPLEAYFPEAGEGVLKDVVGLEASGGTGVWLIGSTKKTGKNRLNDPWARRFDAANPEKSDAPIQRKAQGNVRAVTCAAIGSEGQVMMAGEVLPRSNKTNVFVREFLPEDDEGREADSYYFGEQHDDTPLALCKDLYTWTLYRSGRDACFLNVRETDDPKSKNIAINLGDHFRAVRFMRLGKNKYLIAGTCDGEKGRAVRLYFFARKEALWLSPKPRLKAKTSESVTITGVRVVSPGGTDCIPSGGDPNQQARIWVTLTNGNAMNLTELMLTAALADGAKPHSGFSFRKMHGVDRLGPHESVEIPFWASADASVAPGETIRLNFRLTDEDGKELDTEPNHPIEVCSQKQAPPGGLPADDLFIISPPPGQINKGLKTTVNEYVFEVSTKTRQPLKPGETPGGKTAAASSERPRNQESTLLDSVTTTDGRHQASYRITVRDLKRGENTIYFYLHGSTDVRDSVKIMYEPVKPTLHVLAIAPSGPNYTGVNALYFNDDDARDFAAAMERQKNGRWFGGVRVKTLLLPEETSRTNIEAAFAELLNDFNDRIIQPQDYLVVFMTGHGENVNKEFYLLTSELFNRRAPKATALNFNYIFRDYLSLIGCKKIVFSDACHSAAGGLETGGKNYRDATLLEAQQRAAQFLDGSFSFYSSSSSQSSYEDTAYHNGIYTEALLEALAGKPVQLRNGTMLDPDGGYSDLTCPEADQADYCGRDDRLLSAGELEKFLEIRVSDLILRINEMKNLNLVQTPSFKPLGLPRHLTIFALP